MRRQPATRFRKSLHAPLPLAQGRGRAPAPGGARLLGLLLSIPMPPRPQNAFALAFARVTARAIARATARAIAHATAHAIVRTPARGLAALLLVCSLSAGAQVPGLTLEALPRPAAPPPEKGPVVPSQVEGWRTEAQALEHGDRMPADPVRAALLYCRAARYGDAVAQFNLAWMLTHARGIERNDAHAAHLFAAAAEQGVVQAKNLLARMGTPQGPPPPCLQPPEADPLAQRVAAAAPALSLSPARSPAPPAPAPPRFMDLPPPSQAPAPIVRFVQLVAPEYQLSPTLVLAVMARESNFDPLAESPKNAHGLMQLIPDTARRFNVRQITDPVQNIRGGMAYLRWLLAHFEGDVALALAGYNAGEGAVNRYLGVPPFAETRYYVRRILADVGGQRLHPFDPQAATPSPKLPLMRGLPR